MKPLAGGILLLLAASALADGPLYKWVDDAGKTHYSDAPPLQSQSRGVAELNRQGTVRKPAESEAERKAREASAAAARQLQQRQQQAARYDQALLQSYPSLQDLKAARERQLATLQAALSALQQRARGLALQQNELSRDIAGSQQRKQPIPAIALRNLQTVQNEQRDLAVQLRAKEAEIGGLRQKTQQDIVRYQQLTAQ
ncbi:DUF4124 domain-containing protein [Xenophilus sp. AP218F]|nr:DUF4124 domain-containing protein [Chromobacterium sp. ASV5]OWY40809.1 DUF4124 domain-containing protein [Xenophilus sp. AP218F]